MTYPKSILVIGASGRLGLELLRTLSSQPSSTPAIHAFTRSASKLPKGDKSHCTSIVEGDARNPDDVKQALTSTKADLVIISVGEGDSTAATDVRTATAKVLADVLRDDPVLEDVRVVVLSTVGAGGSKIKLGFGMGKVISFVLRHVIKDHNGQEAAFTEDDSLWKRTIIVRASALTDGKANGKVVTFGDNDKTPSGHIDRGDVAMWITNEVFEENVKYGRTVNITGKK